MVVDATWVELKAEDGRTYFWNRVENSRAWVLPEGISVKWVGQKSPDGRTYYWSRDTKETVWVLPPLRDPSQDGGVDGVNQKAGSATPVASEQVSSAERAATPPEAARQAADSIAMEAAAAVPARELKLKEVEPPLLCEFPSIEPAGPGGSFASSVAARHVIATSGCDSWFHRLPNGEWEEVVRFWPPPEHLSVKRPKLKKPRPDPFGLRDMVLRCQRHEELVRAFLAAQYGNAVRFSPSMFPTPRANEWCFWTQDGKQLVIDANTPQDLEASSSALAGKPVVRRSPPDEERWRLLKAPARASFSLVFKGRRLRSFEKSLSRSDKVAVQEIIDELGADLPENLSAQAQRLLAPPPAKQPPPTKQPPPNYGPSDTSLGQPPPPNFPMPQQNSSIGVGPALPMQAGMATCQGLPQPAGIQAAFPPAQGFSTHSQVAAGQPLPQHMLPCMGGAQGMGMQGQCMQTAAPNQQALGQPGACFQATSLQQPGMHSHVDHATTASKAAMATEGWAKSSSLAENVAAPFAKSSSLSKAATMGVGPPSASTQVGSLPAGAPPQMQLVSGKSASFRPFHPSFGGNLGSGLPGIPQQQMPGPAAAKQVTMQASHGFASPMSPTPNEPAFGKATPQGMFGGNIVPSAKFGGIAGSGGGMIGGLSGMQSGMMTHPQGDVAAVAQLVSVSGPPLGQTGLDKQQMVQTGACMSSGSGSTMNPVGSHSSPPLGVQTNIAPNWKASAPPASSAMPEIAQVALSQPPPPAKAPPTSSMVASDGSTRGGCLSHSTASLSTSVPPAISTNPNLDDAGTVPVSAPLEPTGAEMNGALPLGAEEEAPWASRKRRRAGVGTVTAEPGPCNGGQSQQATAPAPTPPQGVSESPSSAPRDLTRGNSDRAAAERVVVAAERLAAASQGNSMRTEVGIVTAPEELIKRKVVVSNILPPAKTTELADFFTGAIFSATGHMLAAQWQSGEASKVVVGVELLPGTSFGSTAAEITLGTEMGATVAVALHGIQFKGKPLEIRRPQGAQLPTKRPKLQGISIKDLVAGASAEGSSKTISSPSVIGSNVGSSSQVSMQTVGTVQDIAASPCVQLSGIPSSMSTQSVFDLLQQFGGPLKTLNLAQKTGSGEHLGHGFAEYVDAASAREAVSFSPLLGFIEVKVSSPDEAGVPEAKRPRRSKFDSDGDPFEAALQQRSQRLSEKDVIDLGPFEAVLPPARGTPPPPSVSVADDLGPFEAVLSSLPPNPVGAAQAGVPVVVLDGPPADDLGPFEDVLPPFKPASPAEYGEKNGVSKDDLGPFGAAVRGYTQQRES